MKKSSVTTPENRIQQCLEAGVQGGVFPGAAALVAVRGDLLCSLAAGRCASSNRGNPYRHDPVRENTIFDLASLTKPLATALAVMVLVDRGKLDIDQPLGALTDAIPLGNKADLTPRLLLCHSAGFKDWEPFFRLLPEYETAAAVRKTATAARKAAAVKDLIRQRLIQAPLQYAPGTDFLYSDLGFMVLEWMVEALSGAAMHTLLEECLFRPLALTRTFLFRRDQSLRFETDAFAATEACPWRNRVLRGEVHDENAYAMGGYSGHAGLFSDIEGVYRILRTIRDHYQDRRRDILEPATVKTFLARQDLVTGSPWALGWDGPSGEHSAAGEYFSPRSVGHLGFTGTSVWMDMEKDVIVILLTNRIHPTRNNTKIRDFRPLFHNLVMEQVGMA